MDRGQLAYWEARSRDWLSAPPLWPVADDIEWYEARVRDAAATGRSLRVLMLGVTQGIATMRRPAGIQLAAVDWSQGMIARVWPRSGKPNGASVLCADWRELPIATASIDIAVGDNASSTLPTPDDIALHFREIARILRVGGAYCSRCFCRAEPAPAEDELFDGLFAGRISNLDLFRFLLAMSLQGDSGAGVRLGDVLRVWNRRVPDPAGLRERYGWTETALANFASWRDHDGRHYFPSAAELMRLASPGLESVSCEASPYALGENFSRIVLRRAAG